MSEKMARRQVKLCNDELLVISDLLLENDGLFIDKFKMKLLGFWQSLREIKLKLA